MLAAVCTRESARIHWNLRVEPPWIRREWSGRRNVKNQTAGEDAAARDERRRLVLRERCSVSYRFFQLVVQFKR